MALAYGFGHAAGFGFGLGFLNLLGTVLFFLLIVFLIRTLMWGGRHRPHARGPHDGDGSGDGSGGAPWKHGPWREWMRDDTAPAPATHEEADEAMEVARQRLAEGEIEPEAFATIREGLERSRGAPRNAATDAALRTVRLRFARGEIDRERFDAVRDALA